MPEIEIALEAAQVVSYASTHNGRPIVQTLHISSSEETAATISIELTSLGESLAEPWVREVPSLGPAGTRWDDVDLRLRADILYDVTDQRSAELTTRVNGEVRKAIPIQVLAVNAWFWDTPASNLELPAFVMPNHPSLRAVLDDAEQRLTVKGLSGYQGGPSHVTEMVDAIYEAVRATGLTYVDPLPSWDMYNGRQPTGQKIRNPGEVLADHAGTCLDTAILMASLLENVGIRPLLVVIPGHALVGYWRSDEEADSFPESVVPLSDAINFVDTGRIVLVETTTLCGRDQSAPYKEAVAQGRQRIVGEALEDVRSKVVDVASARMRDRVLPIPARVIRGDGTVEIVEYRPAEFRVNLLQQALSEENGGVRAGLLKMTAPPRVNRWMNSLLDLSLRNPLINYRSPMSSSLGLAVPLGTLGTVENLLQSGHELKLLPGVDEKLNAREEQTDNNEHLEALLTTSRAITTNATEDTFLPRARRIASLAKTLVQDTGNNNLFLAMGSLVWTPEGKNSVRSPLILIPVTLKSYNRSKQFSLVIDETSAVTPNFSLAEKLLQDADFRLPKLIEPEMDDAGVDIDGLLAYVREEITKAKLQGFRVDESCTLGFFDFSTYRLWRDLSDNWSTFVKAPLVNHLVHTPQLEFTDTAAETPEPTPDELDELAALLPVSTDGSQVTAVSNAMAGKTFVLQGPPGTGKSQTITNLLARALHSGKRVLFIAEKPPALDVVKDRLEAVGLAPFILNLHSKSLRPAAVRQQLLAVLDAAISADRDGYDASLTDLHRVLPVLQKYPGRVHARGKFDESAYSARNKLLAQSDVGTLTIPGSFLTNFDLTTKTEISKALRDAAEVGTTAGTASENPWSLSELTPGELTSELSAMITQLAQQISTTFTEATRSEAGRHFLDTVESVGEIPYLAGLANPGLPPLVTIDAAATPEATAEREALVRDLDRLDTNPHGPFVGPQSAAAPVTELAAAMETARHSFFIGRRKKVEAVCRQLEAFAAAPVTREQFDAALDAVSTAQADAFAIAARSGIADWNPLDPAARPAVRTQLQWTEYWVALLGPTGTPARDRIRAIANGEHAALAALGVAARDLFRNIRRSEAATELWLGDRSAAEAFARSVDLWHSDAADRGLARLRRWAALTELLEPLTTTGLDRARTALLKGEIPFLDAEAAFERGFLQMAFVRQLDDEGLDTFDGAAHDRSVRAFSRATDETRAAIPGILGTDLIAGRGFDSGVTIGAVGELKRELSRTRGGKSIRKLMIDHWNVISRLTPCVLASPDSVVRFIDADLEPFDLVVFDEASQIRVPHAIGALGRAKAAVIVGDSKQMPPTSIMEVTAIEEESDDEDEVIVFDEESILSESVQARVPDVMLAWHYRSEDESLIAFSNQQYYDGRLSTFPASSANLSDKGLSFVRVQGFFNRAALPRDRFRTNIEEANAIVGEIVRRLHDDSLSHSILVVTFNKHQQNLITSLLTELGDELVDDAMQSDDAESLLIRNLEDVQGQERDIVLFSVAFSKNDGPTLPLTFGPLNRAGGERRLNVAVTRARRQVIVYCSFEPSDLRVEASSSVGLRHLRTYLELAKFGPAASGAVSSQIVRPPDRHRDEILAALRDVGLVCEADVGLSDFKVDIAIQDPDDPSRRLVGILLDGTSWDTRLTVGDRDNLPAETLLAKMHWPAIERIWMPTWVRDRQGELARLQAVVAELKSRPPLVEPVETLPTLPFVEPVATSSTPASASSLGYPGIETWKPWMLRRIGDATDLDNLRSPQVIQGISAIAQEIVQSEGPISPNRYTRLIAQAHDLQSVSTRRAEELLAVPTSLERDEEGFFYPAGQGALTYDTWKKSEPGTGREIADISLTELSNAMRDMARIGLGISPDDLVRLTVQAFGTSRVTTGIRERADEAIAYGIARGLLVERAGYIEAQ